MRPESLADVCLQVIFFHTLSANCHERVFYGDFKFPLFLTMIEFFSNACIAGTPPPSSHRQLHHHRARIFYSSSESLTMLANTPSSQE
jgi:hypothetical protein